MATQVQFRRGTTTQNNNFTGAEGELSVNLSNYSLRLHDGVTAGGYEIARQDFTNATFGTTVLPTLNTTYNLGSSTFKFLNIHSQEFTGALTGNADTATALQTARNINGVSFDGTADITIEASIDKTLFISEGLEDTGGGTQFDGGTDVTLRLKNSPNFSNNTILRWDDTNTQFVDSAITDDGTTVTISGNLNVTGSTTTISTTNLEVTDKLIIIGDGSTDTQGADGAGFNIGTSGVSLTYDLANTSWTSSESWNLATGKTYKIAGTTVIGSTSLGSGIVSSSLTSVGILNDLTVQGAVDFNTTLNVDGISTFRNDINVIDDKKLTFGTSSDLELTHESSTSISRIDSRGSLYITSNNYGDIGTDIYIQAEKGQNSIVCYDDASVELYHAGISKFYTLSSGAFLDGYLISDGTLVRSATNTNTYYEYAINIENMPAGSPYTVDTWNYVNYNAAEYTITFDNYGAQSGSGFSAMQVTKILVMSDGLGNLWTTEQCSLYTDEANPCFTAAASINGSDARLQITPNSNYTNQNNDVKIKVTLYYR